MDFETLSTDSLFYGVCQVMADQIKIEWLNFLDDSDETKIDVWDLLTLFLLFEKQNHKESTVYYFLNSMPKTYTLPLLWDKELIELLPEQTRKVVNETIEEAKKRFEVIESIHSAYWAAEW